MDWVFFKFVFFGIFGLCILSRLLSRVRLFATPWTVAHQAPPPVGFSRQEYWSRLPFPSPGDLADPGIEPRSPALQANALTSEPPGILACLFYSFRSLDLLTVSSVLWGSWRRLRFLLTLTHPRFWIWRSGVAPAGLPVVMCGCESWIIKKAEHQRIDALNCGPGEDS